MHQKHKHDNHHHHRHHGHHHHHHSGSTPDHIVYQGDAPYTVNQGDDNRQYHYHAPDAPQSVLQACLRLIRGLGSAKSREAVLGLLSATLAHEQAISGLEAPHGIAMAKVNHYGIEIE